MSILLVAALAAGALQAPSVDDQQAPQLAKVTTMLHDGQPQQALDALAPVLAAYDAAYASENRRIYCDMSSTETLAYLLTAAKDKTSAVAVGPGLCEALFEKAFALIDLGRMGEARGVLDRTLALAPMHAHFLTEYGQSYRSEQNWPAMIDKCQTAVGTARLASKNEEALEEGRARRCVAFALVEQGKLDEAEQQYRACLKLDPNDERARGELRYINEHRAGR